VPNIVAIGQFWFKLMSKL